MNTSRSIISLFSGLLLVASVALALTLVAPQNAVAFGVGFSSGDLRGNLRNTAAMCCVTRRGAPLQPPVGNSVSCAASTGILIGTISQPGTAMCSGKPHTWRYQCVGSTSSAITAPRCSPVASIGGNGRTPKSTNSAGVVVRRTWSIPPVRH